MVICFVNGQQVVTVEMDRADIPQSLGVTVRIDGQWSWSSEEPGWREIGIGSGSSCSYLWSARRLLILPASGQQGVLTVDSNEDIVVVFSVGAGWLLVCETSLKLVSGDHAISQLELPDAVVSASWTGNKVVVRHATGLPREVIVSGMTMSVAE